MGYTVLLVDDSETIRGAMERTFRMAKLPMDEVIHAANGAEALEILKTRWVDIVLADINMPVMNGVDLVRNMKSNSEWREIPVAIVSTEGSHKRMDELGHAGIAGYLRKPCRPEEIRDLLHQVLGDWKTGE
ncbi:MAG TPA: response regulator [Fibrobacteraceae bacterium]|nr:response regulator [Fibrobacteraceae bacterium]